MTVTINLVYIIAVWLYALVVTGFWVCALIGSGKDRQDAIMEAKDKRELAEANDRLRAEIETIQSGRRTLAEQYINIQNEYAYYRTLVRTADPKAHESASVSMYKQKCAAGTKPCNPGIGGTASAATEEAQNG